MSGIPAPSGITIPPGRDLGPGIPTSQKGPRTRHTPSPHKDLERGTEHTQPTGGHNDRHLWKHYFPGTSLAGGKNARMRCYERNLTNVNYRSLRNELKILYASCFCSDIRLTWNISSSRRPNRTICMHPTNNWQLQVIKSKMFYQYNLLMNIAVVCTTYSSEHPTKLIHLVPYPERIQCSKILQCKQMISTVQYA